MTEEAHRHDADFLKGKVIADATALAGRGR